MTTIIAALAMTLAKAKRQIASAQYATTPASVIIGWSHEHCIRSDCRFSKRLWTAPIDPVPGIYYLGAL
jgi:hypothetical protein